MFTRFSSLALGIAVLALTCGWSPSDARTEDPALTARAKAFVAALEAGRIDRAAVDPSVSAALGDDVVAKLAGQLRGAGEIRWTFVSRISAERYDIAFYRLASRLGTLRLSFGADRSGRVRDFRLRPEAGAEAAPGGAS